MQNSPTTYFKKILRGMGVDRAIGYGVLGKVWQLFAGPVTLILISLHLSPEVQGFYYTFISLIALQSFVELGFFVVITQFASHEWSDLDIDTKGNITGNPKALSRLVSLGRLVFKWYACASALFIMAVGAGGFWFLSQNPHPDINWELPWLIYIILSGIELWTLPFLSLLEGCNQVTNIQLLRLIQSIAKSLVMWAIMVTGKGLWIAVGAVGASLLVEAGVLFFKYRFFFIPFFTLKIDDHISWKTEIWPMQWRLAVSGFGGYLVHSIYTPVLFHYHGPIVAGQMGMTLQLAGMVESLAMMWVATKVPRFGMLIAKKNWIELDRLFFRSSFASMGVVVAGSIALWGIVFGLNSFEHSFAQRLLPPLPLAIILLAIVFLQVVYCQYYYLRAHKKEPVMKLNVAYSLANGLLVWALGSQFGAMGASTGYLITTGLILFPFSTLIFSRCRKAWHQP
ncbi:MAG: hypothetical protein HOJ79_00530 [Nitrospina sp.]|nr:hypothetical protein [Nitrospina sp.]